MNRILRLRFFALPAPSRKLSLREQQQQPISFGNQIHNNFFFPVLPLVCVVTWSATMITQSPDQYCLPELAASSGGEGIPPTAASSASESATPAETSSSPHKLMMATTPCEGNNTCWEGYTEKPYLYILSIPMMFALAVRCITTIYENVLF